MTRSLTDDFQYKSEILTSKFNDWFEPAEFWRLCYVLIHQMFFGINTYFIISYLVICNLVMTY